MTRYDTTDSSGKFVKNKDFGGFFCLCLGFWDSFFFFLSVFNIKGITKVYALECALKNEKKEKKQTYTYNSVDSKKTL